VNRPAFGFNDRLDRYLIEPVATGWAFITPRVFRVALDKLFKNWEFPVRFVSNLGQGELRQGGSELARFLTNTTAGLLGFFDPASRLGLEQYDEDFGQMFGRWGAPAGPYWVIPIFGPSTPRDALGLIFDSALTLPPFSAVPRLINGRAIAAPQIDLAREAALDYYVFVRDAYVQARLAQVRNEDMADSEVGGSLPDNFYDLTDDLYEEEEGGGNKTDSGEQP
jgi:phospholipid-binding lipoprotein MlaA